MSQFANPPETPGARVGDDLQQQMLQAAEHERQVHETEEIHREEAAEDAAEGKSLPKRPWWKFWS